MALTPTACPPSPACFATGLHPGTSPTSQGTSLLLWTAALGLCSFGDGQAISEIMLVCRQRGGKIRHLSPSSFSISRGFIPGDLRCPLLLLLGFLAVAADTSCSLHISWLLFPVPTAATGVLVCLHPLRVFLGGQMSFLPQPRCSSDSRAKLLRKK